jgi:sugar lactone lactonase YvrE
MNKTTLSFLLVASVCTSALTFATETENLGLRVLPVPSRVEGPAPHSTSSTSSPQAGSGQAGKVVVDGKFDDWDLTGGVFTTGDAENLREKLATWFHAMYDAEHLYLLTRWIDQSPMSNPGTTKGDYGFAGDCLQARIITQPDQADKERCTHLTAWRDRDGLDVIDAAWGRKFDQGGEKDLQTKGASQEFHKSDDGPSTGSGQAKGYVQEIAIPWKLLCTDGYTPKAGDKITITLEPNFNTEANMRITFKDIFKPGVTPNRVFTFMSSPCWGAGTLEAKGKGTPQPVRLADAREFVVRMEQSPEAPLTGVPAVDWMGLIKSKELKGFKTVEFEMPADGYISLQLLAADGAVVRQLLNSAFYTKGKHEVKWDGLTTPNWRTPGEPVPAGEYTWRALTHSGLGLRLRGWACNDGKAPWDGPSGKDNWGGDHGQPVSAASDPAGSGTGGKQVYLGWSGAEAGKALVACDGDGNVVWRCSRQGMSGAMLMAADAGTVYSVNWDGILFRVDNAKGGFTDWAGTGSTDLTMNNYVTAVPEAERGKLRASALAAAKGKLFVGYRAQNLVLVLDATNGKLVKELKVTEPVDLEAGPDGTLFVISAGTSVLAVNPESGEAKPFVQGLMAANGIAVDAQGKVYVGVGEPDNQVKVYDATGKATGTIGRKGGRALLGKWQPEGMRFIGGMAVDGNGRLWVMENDSFPKRVSVWDVTTGALYKEFFGPTSYGALGGAINPLDPMTMVGQGCEWKLDPKTGKAACVAVISRDGMENSRFGIGANGRLHLAVATRWSYDLGEIGFFERRGEGDWVRRAKLWYVDKDGKDIPPPAHGQTGAAAKTAFWADQNDDAQVQPGEVTLADGIIRLSGWYMAMTPDMTFYSGDRQFKVTGFTACGAPRYDLANGAKLPAAGWGSADATTLLKPGDYMVNNGWFRGYNVATGKELWSYPDNFVGVHGSHNAVPAEVGMIRGSFGPCGTVKLPDPIGNIWVIPTNVGEWHILTQDGFYLSRLFQGDPMKMAFPETAQPGAILDNAPCGMGGEDFGGSITLARDGKLYLQAGKTGFWNVEVTGLDTVKALKGGNVAISADDLKTAATFKADYLQETAGMKRLDIAKKTVAFSGDLAKDFAGLEPASYKKTDDAAVRTALAWDEQYLYAAWDVKDSTPWVNGATDPAQMYTGGDTVDLQLGSDPKAAKDRAAAVAGDLRLSIGPSAALGGKPVAVIFRAVSATKKPRTFSSGVVKSYTMDFVDVVADAKVDVKTQPGKGYLVEAAIPWTALGVTPAAAGVLRGDFGVTHGDLSGTRTRLRTYWSNQHSGIVDDAVFELQMEPRNWGELVFQ